MVIETSNLESSAEHERLTHIREQISRCQVIFDNGDQNTTQNTNTVGVTESINARLALCINLYSREIYIGESHYTMFSKHQILVEHYLTGIYIITSDRKVHVENLIDWNPQNRKEIEDEEIKNIVANRIQNFITGQETLGL